MSTLTCAGRRPAPRPRRDQRDEGVGAQLVERPAAVGLGPFGGDRRVQRGGESGVGFRVQA